MNVRQEYQSFIYYCHCHYYYFTLIHLLCVYVVVRGQLVDVGSTTWVLEEQGQVIRPDGVGDLMLEPPHWSVPILVLFVPFVVIN